MNWGRFFLGIAPYALAAAKVAPSIVPVVVHAAREAEDLAGATGPQKKAHVMAIVRDTIEAFNLARPHTPIEPAATIAATSIGIDKAIAHANELSRLYAADVAGV